MPLVFKSYASPAALSVGMHAAIAILLLWRGAVVFENREEKHNWRRSAMSWVVLPENPPTRTVTVPTIVPHVHDLVKRDDVLPPVLFTALPISRLSPLRASLPVPLPPPLPSPAGIDDGVSGGSGKGPSCGGSMEVVASPGADAEPASDDSVGDRFEADDQREHFVQFWIRVDGRVTKIAVSPSIRDSNYRRRFMEALSTFVFGRVTLPDGRPIDYVYSCMVYPQPLPKPQLAER